MFCRLRRKTVLHTVSRMVFLESYRGHWCSDIELHFQHFRSSVESCSLELLFYSLR